MLCEEALKDTADLRQTLYKEMLGRIQEMTNLLVKWPVLALFSHRA